MYHFQDVLGKGAFGCVVLGVKREGTASLKKEELKVGVTRERDGGGKVAIKIIRKSKIIKDIDGLKSILNEFRMHWALD